VSVGFCKWATKSIYRFANLRGMKYIFSSFLETVQIFLTSQSTITGWENVSRQQYTKDFATNQLLAVTH
jgi:hypothetical protein